MAIKVVTGCQGSGKTLYSVVQVISKYFEFDNRHDEWKPKLVKDKNGREVFVTVWSNVDGLKLPHINLPKYIAERGMTYAEFFHKDYAEQIMEKYGVNVFVIDEAQTIFRAGLKNEDMAFWHEYHRHWGFDIYYSTQDLDKLSKYIIFPIEFEIRALRRIYALHDRLFVYKLMSDGMTIAKKRMVVKPEHFALYKSSKTTDAGKSPKVLVRMILAASVIFAAVAWGFYDQMSDMSGGGKSAKSVQVDQEEKKSPSRPGPDPAAGVSAAGSVAKPAAVTRYDYPGDGSPPRVTLAGAAISPVPTRPAPASVVTTIPVNAGVFWVEDRLVYITLFGKTFSASEIPYSHKIEGRRVTVFVPESELLSVKNGVGNYTDPHRVGSFRSDDDSYSHPVPRHQNIPEMPTPPPVPPVPDSAALALK